MRAKALETGGTPSHFNDSGSKSKARRIPTEIIGYPGDTVNLHDRNVSPCIMYPVPLADSINASVGVTIPVQKLRVGANGDITMVRNDESITTPAQAPNGQVDVSHILTSEKDVIRYAANHKDPRDV
jgi:hypothetical protein